MSGSHLLCFIIAYSSSSYRKAGCFGFVFPPLNNLYVRFSKWNLATCVKLPFNHEVKCFYRVCPADMVRCGSAVHIWWLCKESQVVLQSIAQWSVDRSRFDICHPVLLKGREKSAFPYAYALIFACSFVQMALWTLFTLRCCPRCFWMPMDKCNNCGILIHKLFTQFWLFFFPFFFFLFNHLFSPALLCMAHFSEGRKSPFTLLNFWEWAVPSSCRHLELPFSCYDSFGALRGWMSLRHCSVPLVSLSMKRCCLM